MENVFLNFLREVIFLNFEENELIWKTFSITFGPTKHEKIGKHSYQTHCKFSLLKPHKTYQGTLAHISQLSRRHGRFLTFLLKQFLISLIILFRIMNNVSTLTPSCEDLEQVMDFRVLHTHTHTHTHAHTHIYISTIPKVFLIDIFTSFYRFLSHRKNNCEGVT